MQLNIITEPSVFVVGCQSVVDKELNNFINTHCPGFVINFDGDSNDDSEELMEVAGRLCYMSFDKPRPGGSAAYFDNIMKQGHGSVLEHGVFNFLLTGISRSLTHELVRHRAGWGYSQLSQRYVDESVPDYVMPWEVQQSNLDDKGDWIRSIEYAHEAYKRQVHGLLCQIKQINHSCPREFLLTRANTSLGERSLLHEVCQQQIPITTEDRKAARSAARSLLPNATETKIFCTANVRALRHFFEMRGSKGAEKEIRIVAATLLNKLTELEFGKLAFGDKEIVLDDKGVPLITSKYVKV